MSLRPFAKYIALALAAAILIPAVALVGAYYYVSASLPKVDTLSDYRPPIITRVYSSNGEIIAEYFKERRIVVPVERMPQQLIQSFVAAEDANFFEHEGIDLPSIARAALKNLRAGGIVQGGSTITQQVAKSLLLTPERKFSRKFKEAILAWRMEQRLSKEGILYLYLNQIYLGHGAYGVQAAAENYYNKNVEDLTLAECAMLAGLPQAPSRYSPYRNFERAKVRQEYVLDRMVKEGFIDAAQAAQAFEQAIEIHPRENRYIRDTAYFTEQVRRYLENRFGEEVLYTQGLEVHTSMDLDQQLAAQAAVRENLRAHDKRRGFRGPLDILTEEQVGDFLAEQMESTFADGLTAVAEPVRAVVTGSTKSTVKLRLGRWQAVFDKQQAKWAGPIEVVSADAASSGNVDGGKTRLPLGSVVEVRILSAAEANKGPLRVELEQAPLAQGALVAMDPKTGLVTAMVGGADFSQSQFNRAVQAQRLPGSAIKPIIFAAALDKGYTPATMILDNPLIYREQAESGELNEWKPKNYENKFHGMTSLREALAHSRNVVTVKILEDIGVGYAINYARKLGIESPLTRDLTLALGSSAVTPMEMATAFSVFANGGVRVSPAYIERIEDRDGRVIESIDPADFSQGLQADQRLLRQEPVRVISPETAYLITNLMESVVQEGTGWRARALGRPVAGKTGTTNDLKDAWFVGYVPQLLAVSWVGYDQERPLGYQETGSRAAAPAWVEFMQSALREVPPRHFTVPDSIEFAPIDPDNGLLAVEDDPDLSIEAFAPGTAPTSYSMDREKPRAEDFFRLDL
ncbi:MAG: penicillin-binding protein 1A [Geoalkalibacter sp.]|uniref:penicillin-binding protein 1A n=1 Tax=Geoalkalibacter sp. TaxID=3041440 RepID=UPI003D09A40F